MAAFVLAGPAPAAADDYQGPIRFAPRFAQQDDRRDDAVPLHNQERTRLSVGVLAGEASIPQRRLPGAPPSLMSQVQALEQAGYGSLICQYGPMKSEGGYAQASFWLGRRALLSDALVQAARKSGGIDVALTTCPGTWGEAMRVGSGRQAAPSAADVATADAAVRQRTGMRHVPALAAASAFDDTRRLHAPTVLQAVDLFDITGSGGGPTTAWRREDGGISPVVLDLQAAGQKVLRCDYVHTTAWRPADGNRRPELLSPAAPASGDLQAVTLRAWYRTRPATVDLQLFKVAENNDLPLVDLAWESCPATWGLALAALNGSAEAQARALQAAQAAGVGPAARRRNSDAEDASLVQRLDAELDRLEGEGAGSAPEAFKAAVQGRIRPLMQTLAASALARADGLSASLAAGDLGAFDAWDRSHGGPLLTGIHRLYLVAVRKAFRWEFEGASLPDLVASGAQLENERNRWFEAALSQRFTQPLWQDLMDAYARRLAAGPALDSRFLEQARRAAALLPDPRSTTAPPAAAQTVPRERQTLVIFGTPGQIATAMVAAQVGRGLGEAAGQAAVLKAEYAAFSQRIGAARMAFWRCYASRCAEAGRLYLAYSAALRDKDLHHLFQPLVYRRLEQSVAGPGRGPGGAGLIDRLNLFMGAGGVDNGTVMGCETEAGVFSAAVQKLVFDPRAGSAFQAVSNGFQRAADTTEYRQWQQCRDRNEWLLRPR